MTVPAAVVVHRELRDAVVETGDPLERALLASLLAAALGEALRRPPHVPAGSVHWEQPGPQPRDGGVVVRARWRSPLGDTRTVDDAVANVIERLRARRDRLDDAGRDFLDRFLGPAVLLALAGAGDVHGFTGEHASASVSGTPDERLAALGRGFEALGVDVVERG